MVYFVFYSHKFGERIFILVLFIINNCIDQAVIMLLLFVVITRKNR